MPIPADVVTTIHRTRHAAGRVTVPGDKSISHRYAMLAALADGVSTIRGYSTGFDCRTTLACIRALGAEVTWEPGLVTIGGRGPRGLTRASGTIDCENSGTTLRLLAGIAAGHGFDTTFTGDESLRRRPMARVITPLTAMGARIESAAGGRPPLTILGGGLHGITHTPEVPSAQVKSCVLLAGLFASGTTTVDEPVPTRDHTERALETFNVPVSRRGPTVGVEGGRTLAPRDLVVPGDISSASFWGALAAGTPDGDITIEGVGLNPTRTAVLDIFRRAGAVVQVEAHASDASEPTGQVRIAAGEHRDFAIHPADVPGVIDEIPALAALAAMMPEGRTLEVRGARELRVKESDRISALAAGFRAMGADVEEYEDGFTLVARPLHGAMVDAAYDHRLAMAFAIAATRASGPVSIFAAAAAAVSYPSFWEELGRLTSPDASAG